jgi:hypothetical protein
LGLALSGQSQTAFEEMALNFANEFDLVTRSTRSYVQELVDLFRSSYGLPPIEDRDAIKDSLDDTDGQDQGSSKDGDQASRQMTKIPHWSFMRPPEFSHVGQVVVLKAASSLAAAAEGGLHLYAHVVPPEEFADLLFCRVSVHKKDIYKHNVSDISEGHVNGRAGWQSRG